jgi:crotonobetainyl-CoA:carnitine CoA-transferase CaiB-like acyl-CoA transferase
MSITSERGAPSKDGVPIDAILAGIQADYGILAALYARRTAWANRVFRSSLLASFIVAQAFPGMRHTISGQSPDELAKHHRPVEPYGGLFAAGDGQAQIAIGGRSHWEALTRLLGMDAEVCRFLTNALRIRHRDRLVATLRERRQGLSSADVMAALKHAGIPCNRVRSISEVHPWSQASFQGWVIIIERPTRPRCAIDPPWALRSASATTPSPEPAEASRRTRIQCEVITRWAGLGATDPLAPCSGSS